MSTRKCFCCGQPLTGKIFLADCADDQKGVEVGPNCFLYIIGQAEYAKKRGIENPGYTHKSGGPALFPHQAIRKGES